MLCLIIYLKVRINNIYKVNMLSEHISYDLNYHIVDLAKIDLEVWTR